MGIMLDLNNAHNVKQCWEIKEGLKRSTRLATGSRIWKMKGVGKFCFKASFLCTRSVRYGVRLFDVIPRLADTRKLPAQQKRLKKNVQIGAMEKKIEPVLSTIQVLVSVWPLNQTLAPTVKYWKTVRWFLKGLGFAGLNHTNNNNCNSTWRTLTQIGRPTLMACFKPLTIHGTDYGPQTRKKKFFLNLNVIKRFYASENFSFPHFPSKKKIYKTILWRLIH